MGNVNCCESDGNKISVRFQRQVLQVKGSIQDKLIQIRSRIAQLKKVSVHCVIISYNGQVLNDNETLLQRKFNPKDDHLNASISSQDDTSLSITIRNINFTEKMQVKTTEMIKQIKRRIDRKHSISTSSQRLIFNGMVLQDDNQVSKYGIQEGSVVHLCVALLKG